MESFFIPIVKKIKDLLDEQLEQTGKKSDVSIKVTFFLLSCVGDSKL